jgi:hypothetical protein
MWAAPTNRPKAIGVADLFIPDVSEYQSVDWSRFAGPIIVRAHNGYRVDHHWQAHAAGAARQAWWGAYQYLPATVNATAAATMLALSLIGYHPNVVILDLEAGGGDQRARQAAWLTEIGKLGITAWTYSGLAFALAHGLNVEWVAAYNQPEPHVPHVLWQYTDKAAVVGVGTCDRSVFHGTIGDLLAITNPSHPQPIEDDMNDLLLCQLSDGAGTVLANLRTGKQHNPGDASHDNVGAYAGAGVKVVVITTAELSKLLADCTP